MPQPVEAVEDSPFPAIPFADNLPQPESRRLTGPGLLWGRPGAVLDVRYEDFDPGRIAALWAHHARKVLDGVGWTGEQAMARHHSGGSNLAISAPLDLLYSAVIAAECIWHLCACELLNRQAEDFSALVGAIRAAMAGEANPALVALLDAAERAGIDALSDDEAVSAGQGAGSQTWPIGQLPDVQAVDWSRLHDIPVAIITGTNGKTTTTRLCAAIARASGQVAGLTSTDLVRVGDDILDRGDYSGPGGARMLLRDKRVEIGFLEVARGGILRRGLAVRHAQACAVLNVAADHLGDYGVNTVAELAEAKFAVRRALGPEGVLVLNADDPLVVAEASRTNGDICWFSLRANAPQIALCASRGASCAWVEAEGLVHFDGVKATRVIGINDIPITLQGRATYNILNALAALCLCKALGIAYEPIRLGLAQFENNQSDNPGRLNQFKIRGGQVFVDYAHNPHSIAAVTQALSSVKASRRIVMLGNAGDRSDEAICEMTEIAFQLKPEFIVIAELPDYLRGRLSGEMTAVIRGKCLALGMADDHILEVPTPLAGAAKVIEMVQPGDLALLLVHSHRDAVFDLLNSSVAGDGEPPQLPASG